MTEPAPLTSTTFVDGEEVTSAKLYTRVLTVINWLLGQFGDTGWITPTLGNSWVSFDAGATFDIPQYRRFNGVVFLKGEMKSGTSNTTVFTLPAGYRPLKQISFCVQSNTGSADILVGATGAVIVNNYNGGSNASVSLNGISFIAEA